MDDKALDALREIATSEFVSDGWVKELAINALAEERSGETDQVHAAADTTATPASPPPGEGLTPVAWRWRWTKLGSNTAWHISTGKPGPFAEDGYVVEPLYTHPAPSRADIERETLERAAKVAEARYVPQIIEFQEGGYAELVLEDTASVTGEPVIVRPMYRMTEPRDLLGFTWDLPLASISSGTTSPC
jgi:hypothetical protein